MRQLYLHRRFFFVVLGGVFALLLAFVLPFLYPWVVWCLCLAGVLLAVDVVLLYGFGACVEARRTAADRFSNGEENPVYIHIAHRYPFRIHVRLMDEAPVEFQQRETNLQFALGAGEEREVSYTLRPVRRGTYTFGQIRVFVSSHLGLVERRYSFRDDRTVAVYPSLIAMRKFELLAFTGPQGGNGGRKMQVPGISTAFEQIKPYIQGDDPRTVNWKATAKCNRLMVNAYTEERSQQVYCVIDKGRTMQSPFRGMTILDYAINATLALANVILKKGDKAGLLTFANKPGTLIRADNRRLQLNHICEALYNQQTHYLESDLEQVCIVASRRMPTRSLLVLFTNYDTVTGMQHSLPALHRLARTHLLLVVLFENTEVNRAVTQEGYALSDLYFKALAGSFITEKRRIAQELRKAGIYTLLTEPEKLTANAINAYLELKERGML